jgi:hypothetical protein
VKRLLLAILSFALPCGAQQVMSKSQVMAKSQILAANPVSVTGEWAYLQATSGTTTGAGGWEVQDGACGTLGTSTACSFKIFATTAGSFLRAGITTGNNLTISSAFSCVSSNPCLTGSGDKVDTFVNCTSSTCHIFNSGNDNEDAWHVLGGAGGATIVTINLSGTSTSFQFLEFKEYAPPNCSGTPCAMSIDNSGNGSTASHSSAGCTPCTGPSFTLTGTNDLIVEQIDSGAGIASPSSPYILDFIGDPANLDTSSGAAITFNTTNYFSLTAVAVKPATAYTAPSTPFSYISQGIPGTTSTTAPQTCSPGCPAITLPVTANAGDLIFFHAQVQPGSTQATISSVVDNGSGGSANTWTVPSAANTCKQTGGSVDLSCGYTVATRTSTSTFTPTMSASTTAYFIYYVIRASSGTIALDTQNSSTSGVGSQTVTGQTLTLTNGGVGPDVCFAELGWASASQIEWVAYLYPSPQGSNFFGGYGANNAQGVSMMLLNARTGAAPKVLLSASTASQESSGICFHN